MRKKQQTWTIYSLMINGKVYYGRCKSIRSRMILHKHQCFTLNAKSLIYKWVRLSGIDEFNWDSNVEVTLHATCFDLDEANRLEVEYTLNHYNTNPETLLNMKAGEFRIANVLDPDSRICTDCKQILLKSKFCCNKAYPGGKDNVCKACKEKRRRVRFNLTPL